MCFTSKDTSCSIVAWNWWFSRMLRSNIACGRVEVHLTHSGFHQVTSHGTYSSPSSWPWPLWPFHCLGAVHSWRVEPPSVSWFIHCLLEFVPGVVGAFDCAVFKVISSFLFFWFWPSYSFLLFHLLYYKSTQFLCIFPLSESPFCERELWGFVSQTSAQL